MYKNNARDDLKKTKTETILRSIRPNSKIGRSLISFWTASGNMYSLSVWSFVFLTRHILLIKSSAVQKAKSQPQDG